MRNKVALGQLELENPGVEASTVRETGEVADVAISHSLPVSGIVKSVIGPARSWASVAATAVPSGLLTPRIDTSKWAAARR